jgi:hypothetical protein
MEMDWDDCYEFQVATRIEAFLGTLAAGDPFSLEQIVTVLWPELDEATARDRAGELHEDMGQIGLGPKPTEYVAMNRQYRSTLVETLTRACPFSKFCHRCHNLENAQKINRVNAPPGSGEFYRYESTGKLTVQLGDYSSYSWHRTWNDGARQRVEDCLNAFIIEAVDRTQVVRREEAERAERERLREIEEQKRAEEAKRERIEGEKAKRLKELVQDQQLAADIRSYIAAQRAILDSLRDQKHRPLIEEWLAWAAEYADKIDPIPTYSVPVIKDPGESPWQRGRDGY